MGPLNAIKRELESFLEAIERDITPPVTISDGYEALDVAHQIIRKIDESPANFKELSGE